MVDFVFYLDLFDGEDGKFLIILLGVDIINVLDI